MKLSKKWMPVTLAIILCISLIACGKDKNAFSEQDYVGAWKYAEHGWIVVIADDGTWYDMSTEDASGVTRIEDGSLQLVSAATGSVFLELTMQDNNTLTETEGDRLVRISLSDLHDTASADLEDFLGDWEYDDYDSVLTIFNDGTWTAMSQAGEVGMAEKYVFEHGALILLDGNGKEHDRLVLCGKDALIDSNGDALSRYDGMATGDMRRLIEGDTDSNTYLAYDIGVQIWYQKDMNLMEYTIPDAIAVYDSDYDIHATVRNVTAAYLGSQLGTEDFIAECVDTFMAQDMYHLFGTEQINSDEYADLGRSSSLSSCRVRLFWNDVDIHVEAELCASYDTDSEEQTQYVLKCFYAQYENLVNGPLEYMWDSVEGEAMPIA